MKISVIIATNRKGGLEFQLPSLAKQKFPKDDFEVIVVDDSEREAKDVLGLDAGIHNFHWMRSKPSHWRTNAGIGNARNTGLILASGKLVIFIDDYTYVKPEFLHEHWKVYETFYPPYVMLAPVLRLTYSETFDPNNLNIRGADDKRTMLSRGGYGIAPRVIQRGAFENRHQLKDAPSGWYWTSNASAPLDKIIEANGFWEIMDLTREEDCMMGTLLQRAGVRFWFKSNPNATAYHMDHDEHSIQAPRKFKEVTFEELYKRDYTYQRLGNLLLGRGLDTHSDEVQLLTKDVFNTKYDGSWACFEHLTNDPTYVANSEIRFNLKEERERIRLGTH